MALSIRLTDANWIMIAPIMPGNIVRTRYEEGHGVIGQFAIENDSTGTERNLVLALCKGIGLTRAGIYETSFRGEALLNDEIKDQARHNFVHDIKGGAIVKEWTENNVAATKRRGRKC